MGKGFSEKLRGKNSFVEENSFVEKTL